MSLLVAALALAAAGCGSGGATDAANATTVISAVGAENEYANVLGQIGGRYVRVSAVLDNPNTDPHTFEASPKVAQEVSSAQLIVQNGLGYDGWMNKIESASPNTGRKVITVQQVLGLPDSSPNPHLWYDPATMPAVAKAIAARLSALQPGHKAYFQARLQAFNRSLDPWRNAIAAFKAKYPGTTAGDGDHEPDPVQVPGRHHERHRSRAAGHRAGEQLVRPAQGQAVRLQPAGDRLPHLLDTRQCAQGRSAAGRRL
jgi:zinc/manganese transport system substrate-binding protein